eukprot:3212759-Rhodomonas_salina.1
MQRRRRKRRRRKRRRRRRKRRREKASPVSSLSLSARPLCTASAPAWCTAPPSLPPTLPLLLPPRSSPFPSLGRLPAHLRGAPGAARAGSVPQPRSPHPPSAAPTPLPAPAPAPPRLSVSSGRRLRVGGRV